MLTSAGGARRFGTLSTVGSKGDAAGFPTGSVVQYAADAGGRPVFAFSSLSAHMQDLRRDPRCSLTVTAPTFKARPQRQHRKPPPGPSTDLLKLPFILCDTIGIRYISKSIISNALVIDGPPGFKEWSDDASTAKEYHVHSKKSKSSESCL